MKDRGDENGHHYAKPGFEPSMGLEERSLARAHRARKREMKRRRRRALLIAAALLLVLSVITLGVVIARSGGSGAGERRPSTKGDLKAPTSDRAASSNPASSTPDDSRPQLPDQGSTAKEENPPRSCWVDSRMPGRRAKESDTSAPTVAIVVDDVGNGRDPLAAWIAIDAPVTFAVMPHCEPSGELASRLYWSGYEIMMHIPTQNAPPNSFSGKGQLSVGMNRGNVFAQLDSNVSGIPYVRGINNHQGGLGCDDPALMASMCEWAKSRGLYIVDSNSSRNSQVTPATLALGLPKRKNQVFIDHQNDPEYIRGAMRELAGIARKNGTAIGICHWHRPNTPTVVGEMVKELKKAGINFAFVADITN